jgi:hypothetical protein
MTERPRQVIRSLACEDCGSLDLLAVSPGTEADIGPGGIVLRRATPTRAWCPSCWPHRGAYLIVAGETNNAKKAQRRGRRTTARAPAA